MSVTVNDKNLGHATAYAYAKSKGYAGTEEEFAELMASYAEVATDARGYAEQAEQSASNAQTSATNASASATTADTKASEASASALSAQQSATSASTSAGNASASANSASASAQTATTKASEAEQSATEASESATSANSAKEDAVTAKEEAQASAEEAKASEEAIDLALAKLDASLITDTATGNPSIFPDGANLPVKSLTAEINPVQDLNGYDYPWVWGAGTNKYDESKKTSSLIDENGNVSASNAWYLSDYCEIPVGTTNVTLSWELTSIYYQGRVTAFDSNKSFITGSFKSFAGNVYTHTFDIPSTAKYVRVNYSYIIGGTEHQRTNVRLNVGSDDLGYAPYENICPITGYDSVEVTRTGKNLLGVTATTQTINGVTFTVNDDGTVNVNGTATANAVFTLNSYDFDGTAVILNGCPDGGSVSTFKLDAFGASGLSEDIGSGVTISTSGTRNVRIVVFSGATVSNKLFKPMIRLASITDSTYEPYQSQTVEVTLNDTTYGGTLNVTTGELVVDRAMVTLDGNTQWTQYAVGKYYSSAVAPNMAGGSAVANMFISNLYKFEGEGGSASSAITTDKRFYGQRGYSRFWIYDSSFDTVEALKSMLADTPMTVVYPLDTPQTIQLTASQLSTILGTNVISADSGAVTVEYYANTKLYINKVVNAQS